MDQDFSSKIERLKDMLNDENVSENIKNVMDMMSNNSTQSEDNNLNDSIKPSNIDANTMALISKVKTILDKKNTINDPRINLLNSIKPYLNTKRQERIENFSKILNYTLLAQILSQEKF